MSAGRPFLDSNILLYAHTNDKERAPVAWELIKSGGTISVQVLNEFAAVANRKLRQPWKQIKSALEDLVLVLPEPIPLTLELHKTAIEIAERHHYTIYDASIIAAALKANCETLFSEDMQHGQKIKNLTIRNPF